MKTFQFENFEVKGDRWVEYRGEDRDVVVPESLVSMVDQGDICLDINLPCCDSVTLPKNVSRISFCFSWDTGTTIKAFHVDPENPWLKDVDGVLFTKDGKTLVRFPGNREGVYIVPDGVETLGSKAFAYANKIEKVLLPDSLKEVGRDCFDRCSSLRTLTIPAGVTEWDFYEFGAGNGLSALQEFSFLGSGVKIPNGTGADVGVIESYITPSIPSCYLLACFQQGFASSILKKHRKRLLAVAKVEGVTEVAAWLESIAPAKVRLRCKFTFEALPDGAAKLRRYAGNQPEVEIPASWEGRPVVSIGYEAFKKNADVVRVIVPEGVKEIGADAFSRCVSLEEIVLPKSCRKIGPGAFLGCISLEKIVLPKSCKKIGYGSFSDCKMLRSVNLPLGLTDLECNIFCNCVSLESLVLPAGLKEISANALNGCVKLAGLELPDGLESLGDGSLCGCAFDHGPVQEDGGGYSLADFTIPASVTWLGKEIFARYSRPGEGFPAFYYCVRLRVVKDSAAHKYAVKNGIEFVFVE